MNSDAALEFRATRISAEVNAGRIRAVDIAADALASPGLRPLNNVAGPLRVIPK